MALYTQTKPTNDGTGDWSWLAIADAAQGAKADSAVQPAALGAKQDVLVSGTNIKTVNGSSLLGSGDLPIAGGGGQLCLPLVADGAGLTLTNMAAALAFLAGSHRYAGKIDLTSMTQVRLIVNKQGTAGAAASKIILRYRTAFDTTAANWLDIGTSEVSVAINVQNSVLATAWISLAALAKADVFVTVLCSGGDGALDPVVGNITAQFK